MGEAGFFRIILMNHPHFLRRNKQLTAQLTDTLLTELFSASYIPISDDELQGFGSECVLRAD